MYQFSARVQDHDEGFAHLLDDLGRQVSSFPADRMLFHIYSTVFDLQNLSDLIAALRGQFAGCQIVCCTVAGAALDHAYQEGVIVSAEVFEYESSIAELHTYDLTDSSDEAVAGEIRWFVQEHPWVKAVEIHRTVHDMNTTDFCAGIDKLPENIIAFGGLVCARYISDNLSYIFDQSGRPMDKGVVVVYYGGSDLHIKSCKMSGWKSINKPFTVTKAYKNIIQEIDGAPAHEIYKRYLDITPDDSFVLNVLEFPMLSEERGSSVVRNVFSLTPDGGFIVAYDMPVGTRLRICYADAATISEDIGAVSGEIAQFAPDVVSVVSCVTRGMIWQMKDYMPELNGLKEVAPCHGYRSHGEFIREDGVFNHHNTIMVAVAFREGDPKDISCPAQTRSDAPVIPLAARLSTFINRVTDELKDMYSEVEQAATTDALTQIGNRYLFDDVVKSASADTGCAHTKYLLMFDLNELKFVNDTYGHNEGDLLIKTAAETIANAFSRYGQCFRIGGDEFAVIADFESEAALQGALNDFHASVRERNQTFPYVLSIAVGCAALINAEGRLLNVTEWRSTADINMYRDKAKFHSIRSSALSESMVEFLSCVMSLVDNKNPAFSYHSERVQRMALAIAQRMGVAEPVAEKVKLGAYLHDIGKIGIADEALTKSDIIAGDDRTVLWQLPVISRRLLRTSEDTKAIADIVYACFEHWDGGGYPDGLSGEDIPLESRIIAVANYVDMALHDRYGRAALSEDACIEKLRALSGSMFDPAVITAVVSDFHRIVSGDVVV